MKCELSTLVGSNYTKVLEAASAVSAMKEAASSINFLLQSVDELVTDESGTGEEPPAESCSTFDGHFQRQRRLLDDLWEKLYVGNYDYVAEGLLQTEAELYGGASSRIVDEYGRCRAVLLKLCERTVRRAASLPTADVAKAIKALSLIQAKELGDVIRASLVVDAKQLLDPDQIVRLSKLIHVVCLALEMEGEQQFALIKSLMIPDTMETSSDIMLLAALQLRSYDEKIGGIFFDHWLRRSEERLSKAHLVDLFGLSQTIFERCKVTLPHHWTQQLKSAIRTPIPVESAMLFAPLLATEEQSKLLPISRRSDDSLQERANSEKLLVPLGLPRLVRLSP